MRIVAIFFVIHAAVAIKYPPVTTWGLPELERSLTTNKGDRNSKQCLELVHSSFMIGMMDMDNSKIALKEEDTIAVVPSPVGRDTWSIDELKDAAAVLIEKLGVDRKKIKTEQSKRLSVQQVENAIKLMVPKAGRMNTTDGLINMNILQILYSVLTDEANGEDNKKDGYKLIIPVLDVSVWKSDVLHQALENTSTNPKLVPFLDNAVHGIFSSQSKLNNGKICVVTPVTIMPSKEPYYYLPPATKCLLKKIRNTYQKKDN